ncbi:hypothetical protein [Haliangium sp.]|uniref:hypothetical protein n=1 Tax=Haliangium sp. TaxID=2663208 RepID=UPI003D09E878
MGRLTFAGLLKSRQQRRIEAETFDPSTAPHRGLVGELVRAHLPRLQLRLRERLIDELVLRILEFAPAPESVTEADEFTRITRLISRTQEAIHQIDADLQFLERRFEGLSALLGETNDEDEQRLLMAEYLSQTVSDPRRLRGDIRALRRYLGYDALRERDELERRELTLCAEIGVHFIAGALEALCAPADEDTDVRAATRRAALAPLIDDLRLARFLAELLARNTRWQTRLAAAEALTTLCHYAAEVGRGRTRADLDEGGREDEIVPVAIEAVTSDEEHPWVRAKALEVVLARDPERGERLLLEGLRGGAAATDFLFRRLAVEIMVQVLPSGRVANILDALIAAPGQDEHVRLGAVGIARPEPSEHVRTGLALAALELPPGDAIARLRRLAGLDGHEETSPRVRTQALIAARMLAAGALDLAVREAASTTLVDALAVEVHALPLKSACEELCTLAEELVDMGAEDHLQALAPAWVAALGALGRHPRCAPAMAEAAAAAAERIERAQSRQRRLATAALDELARAIRPGRSRTVRLSKLPAELVEQLRDPAALGRILADLSRDDWGLGARVARRWMTLWRGDHMRRRLWRILHELRHPAPNKRQAYLHTIGRAYRSRVRAHPGRLDEATATTVPGERVLVESEGSWGRHLPTVDDLLDLPLLQRRPVHICSSYGVATLTPSRSFFRRLHARLAISWGYRGMVSLRQSSLASDEAQGRRRYLEQVRSRFGIEIDFRSYDDDPARSPDPSRLNPAVAHLFPGLRALAPAAEPPPSGASGAAMAVAGAAMLAPLDALRDWIDINLPYFTSMTQNSQTALAAFLGLAGVHYLSLAYVKRRKLERARASFPLCVGGWGTRGKSGTERLKAGLFHGLGYDVFTKTTGCEAMLLHAAPGQKPLEIFVYRPYDKATIWEQYNLVSLASRLRPDVFLWECMALNPRYVQLLQSEWMRDDMVTLTNAYPDHEDIQGPAGVDVARVISKFISRGTTLLTSEVNFLPLFAEVCRERNTRMVSVREREGDLIGEDVLALFPYNEHPRNISLVAALARELGIDPTLAIVTMAEHVVADLGVLKSYSSVRVRGRVLTFINGCSANERTGYLNSWRRMGLDQFKHDDAPEDVVITVVNNRADRISRSEVFARVLVRDVDVDRHVLIGTNLKGLVGYLDVAMTDYLSEINIVQEDDLRPDGAPSGQPLKRLRNQMTRLRIPSPSPERALQRLDVYARGIDSMVEEERRTELEAVLARILADDAKASASYAQILRTLMGDRGLAALLDDVLVTAPSARLAEDDIDAQLVSIESLEPATHAEVIEHFLRQLAGMVVRARLEARLARVLERRNASDAAGFENAFRASWRELFEAKLVVVESPDATGDQIIDRCARSVPPGTQVRIMGTQNIKGTGLDFVYRWLAIENVVLALRALQSERTERRVSALRELEAFEDHGVVDAGVARGMLALQPARQPGAEEVHLRERIRTKLDEVYARRMTLLRTQTKQDVFDRVAGVFEGMIDSLDSIGRYRRSRQIMDDLAARRISHGRAALEMRALVARQKGGWLAKSLRKLRRGGNDDDDAPA